MSGARLDIRWKAPGPVAERFMASRKRVQILNGPVGSGKTTAVLIKAIRLASEQRVSKGAFLEVKGFPKPLPLRRFKLTVVRDTYRQLWRSTLPSWWKRVPQDVGDWTGAKDGPAIHTVPIVLSDGTVVQMIVEFIAIGDNNIEDLMRGYEPTAWYLNEADLLARDVYQWARTRWGRFPDRAEGGPSWWGILMDCNAPILGSWLYEEMFLRTPGDVDLYKQPSGFSPQAENLENLPPGYYDEQLGSLDARMLDRMLRNKPGFSSDGMPVHPEFNDSVHVADHELAAIPGIPLSIGMDAGLDPAAVIGQKLGNGHWHILDELATEHGTGPLTFARLLNELLSERYPGWHRHPLNPHMLGHNSGIGSQIRFGRIRAWADPASGYGADKGDAEQTWLDLVSYHTGIRIEPAPTNDTTSRREGLRRVLELMPDGKPAFQLSPRCPKLRSALAGGFRFRKLRLQSTDDRYTDQVDKNEFSHIGEAAEYLMLGGGEGAEIHERRQRGWNVGNLPRQAADYDPYA